MPARAAGFLHRRLRDCRGRCPATRWMASPALSPPHVTGATPPARLVSRVFGFMGTRDGTRADVVDQSAIWGAPTLWGRGPVQSNASLTLFWMAYILAFQRFRVTRPAKTGRLAVPVSATGVNARLAVVTALAAPSALARGDTDRQSPTPLGSLRPLRIPPVKRAERDASWDRPSGACSVHLLKRAARHEPRRVRRDEREPARCSPSALRRGGRETGQRSHWWCTWDCGRQDGGHSAVPTDWPVGSSQVSC